MEEPSFDLVDDLDTFFSDGECGEPPAKAAQLENGVAVGRHVKPKSEASVTSAVSTCDEGTMRFATSVTRHAVVAPTVAVVSSKSPGGTTRPVATIRTTKTWVTVFEAYLHEKQINLDLKTVKAEDLAKILRKFYVEVRRQDGTTYQRPSLMGLRAALLRHIRSPLIERRDLNIITGEEFSETNRAFEAYLKRLDEQGHLRPQEHKNTLTEEDFHACLQYFYGKAESDPRILTQAVWFFLSYRFALRALESRENIKRSHILFTKVGKADVVKLAAEYRQLNYVGDVRTWSEEYLEDPRQVRLIRLLVSKLHPDGEYLYSKARSDSAWTSAEQTWYTRCKLGHNMIGRFMTSLSINVTLSRRYTGFCLRATALADKNNWIAKKMNGQFKTVPTNTVDASPPPCDSRSTDSPVSSGEPTSSMPNLACQSTDETGSCLRPAQPVAVLPLRRSPVDIKQETSTNQPADNESLPVQPIQSVAFSRHTLRPESSTSQPASVAFHPASQRIQPVAIRPRPPLLPERSANQPTEHANHPSVQPRSTQPVAMWQPPSSHPRSPTNRPTHSLSPSFQAVHHVIGPPPLRLRIKTEANQPDYSTHLQPVQRMVILQPASSDLKTLTSQATHSANSSFPQRQPAVLSSSVPTPCPDPEAPRDSSQRSLPTLPPPLLFLPPSVPYLPAAASRKCESSQASQ